MAAFNRFNLVAQDLCRGVHNFQTGGQTFKVLLTNSAPAATWHLLADVTGEVGSGGGYTTGGNASAMSDAIITTTIEKVVAANPTTWTGSGGGMGPFRYAVVYNASASGSPLVAWYDYGSNISLTASDTFTINFDATNGFFQVS